MTQLRTLGFKNATDLEFYDRIIMAVYGLEKQGKTHFALTAPGPIALLSSDVGEEGVIEKFWDNKDIQIFETEKLDEDQADKADEAWLKFKAAFRGALRSTEVRTIIVDTETEVWELIRLARFGRLTQVRPHHYGPVNAEFRSLIRESFEHDKNLILLQKMKAQYVNDKKTGQWERAGFSDLGFLVQVNAQVYRDDVDEGGEFNVYIDTCRQQPELAGELFSGDACNFPFVAMMVKPEADPSSWK